MINPVQSIFREEVHKAKLDRIHGDVHLAVPVSWQIIGFALFASLAAALVFLTTATYARVETVPGAIVLDRGVATILPTRAGIVSAIPASEGQRVRAGDPLVQVNSEEELRSGRTAPLRMMDALEQQDQRLNSQSSMLRNAAAEEQARLRAQIGGIGAEIASLNSQIASQQRLVELAEDEFKSLQSVATTGFISRRDLASREAAFVARAQQLAQIQQVRSARTSELAQAQRTLAHSAAAAEAQVAGLQSNRAELAQRVAEVEGGRGYVLTSPVDGTVTAVTARLGQPASGLQPLMVVLPANGVTRAELHVPSRAAGFLAAGQEVRLAVDAFPSQRFGTIDGRIVQVSTVAVPQAGADGTAVPTYLVTVQLDQPSVMAFGRRQPLLPGMSLSARIVTQRQSLFEWLFEPVLAVARR